MILKIVFKMFIHPDR